MLELKFYPSSIATTRESIESFVGESNAYQSSIMIQIDNKTVNAKSILGLLTIGKITSQAVLIIDGDDENDAYCALKQVICGAEKSSDN